MQLFESFLQKLAKVITIDIYFVFSESSTDFNLYLIDIFTKIIIETHKDISNTFYGTFY